eukprot:NODE_192_length_13323_cov_0.206216.p4 type:complete len:128 gc:universal NODE_192_length_13323_cov_0.206216:4010-3627(-)
MTKIWTILRISVSLNESILKTMIECKIPPEITSPNIKSIYIILPSGEREPIEVDCILANIPKEQIVELTVEYSVELDAYFKSNLEKRRFKTKSINDDLLWSPSLKRKRFSSDTNHIKNESTYSTSSN